MTKLSAPMAVLAGVVGLLVLGDIAFAAVLVSTRSSATPASQSQPQGSATSSHPCNHGYFVSQAAHAKHTGQGQSKVARSSAGKSGSCTKP
ncbi:MAG TPA: hypothetical protein VFL27_00920 [Candidatus Dormibacteraeota bacterium]|nr:hypothetical protein [Candidatus Dormibacteraeota bacterium]